MNVRCNATTVGQFNNTGFTGNAATATTASNLNGTWSQMPSGTRVPFAQASAPTGWTQDTSDNANNRMLRVVNTAGGGVAGTDSPIVNSTTMVAHSHTFTGNALGTHNHSDAGHTHTVNALTTGGGGYWAPGGSGQNNPAAGTTAGYANIQAASAGTPSGTNSTTAGVSWTPRYIDMIICSKN